VNSFKTGVLLVLFSALGCGFIPIFAIYAYQGRASVYTFIFLRSFIAAFIFFVYLFKKSVPFKITSSQILFLFGVGALEALQSCFFLTSVKYIQASLTELVFYTYPIMVAVLSFFFYGEKLSSKKILAIIISFIGLVMVLGTSPGGAKTLGILLALGAAVVCSVVTVLIYKIVSEINAVIAAAFLCLFMGLTVVPIGFFAGELVLDIDLFAWLSIIGCALVSTNMAGLAFLIGVKHIGSTMASVLCMIEPLFTLIFCALLFAQVPTLVQIFGGLLIIAGGVIVVNSRSGKPPKLIKAGKEVG